MMVSILNLLFAGFLNAQVCLTTADAFISFINTCSGNTYTSSQLNSTELETVNTGFKTGQDVACTTACLDSITAANSAILGDTCENEVTLIFYSAFLLTMETTIIKSCVKTADNLDYCINYQNVTSEMAITPAYLCTDCQQRQYEAVIANDRTKSIGNSMKTLFDATCANLEITIVQGSGASSMFSYFGILLSLLFVL